MKYAVGTIYGFFYLIVNTAGGQRVTLPCVSLALAYFRTRLVFYHLTLGYKTYNAVATCRARQVSFVNRVTRA